ncbi:MAG: hypothetical protein SVT52_05540 [Planctomycetota bacterium]|nr:hypothetical protein [Planctomycetota bacterium]
MESYNIIFKPSVEKDLRRLPRGVVGRVMKRIDALVANPLLGGDQTVGQQGLVSHSGW